MKPSPARRAFRGILRFSMIRSLRTLEVDPDRFRQELAQKFHLWVPDFTRMRDVPIEQLDAIGLILIRDAQRIAFAGGAGFGLGGMFTIIPDASLLTLVTLRLIQRLCLLYGFAQHDFDQRVEMWKAAAAASGVDYAKDLAEKQLLENLGPRIARRLAAKLGAEAAEKWVARGIPVASSALSGGLNFTFVRSWGRRVQRHLRERHLAERQWIASGAALTQPATLA
jgi:hypothetical protein